MSGAKIIEWLIIGGVVTAIVKMIENIMLHKMKGRNSKQESLEESILKVQDTLLVIQESEIVILHDRLKYLSKSFISKGAISYDDLRDISNMYNVYKRLGGNGGITYLMETVMELPLS